MNTSKTCLNIETNKKINRKTLKSSSIHSKFQASKNKRIMLCACNYKIVGIETFEDVSSKTYFSLLFMSIHACWGF